MVMGGRINIVDVMDGQRREIGPEGAFPLRPEACVFSPSGNHIAYIRVVDGTNQIFVSGTSKDAGNY
jgi:hypothetical protein